MPHCDEKGPLPSYPDSASWIGWGFGGELQTLALALLPFYVAERTTAVRVSDVEIP